MDKLDWKLISLLQHNSRMTYTDLGHQVHLSVPAVKERIKRLEEIGVIEGYTIRINQVAAGYTVNAVIGIIVPQPAKKKFLKLIESIPEVLECHHVTGAESYIMRIAAVNLTDIERLIEHINLYGETRTSIVMSTPIVARELQQPAIKRGK